MSNEIPVIPEDPSVVRGGPLDPTSAEGQPPEGLSTGETPAAATKEPLYRGVTGDINDAEGLVRYTKQLEELIASARTVAAPPPQVAPAPFQPTAPKNEAKERFSEVIFSKPDEAFEIISSELERRAEAKRAEERQREAYWERFYSANEDLKRMKPVVQSVFENKKSYIATLRTEPEVTQFIAREARNVIDYVKKETGYTETRIPSQSVASLGGSRESVPPPPNQTPSAPKGLVAQLNEARSKRVKR